LQRFDRDSKGVSVLSSSSRFRVPPRNVVVTGDDGVLAPPGDAAGLAAAIDEVLRDYARFDRADIATRAAARYSFKAVGGIWDEVYRSL
jgi:glycosyltransferase involved in cell wall biosynthesis